MYEKLFVTLKGEENRYKSEVDSYIYSNNKYNDIFLCKRKARGEIEFFQAMVQSNTCLAESFYHYTNCFSNVRFHGKLIIRPFRHLYEATLDGVIGCYDSGLLAEGISAEEDGYLFTIRFPGKEQKVFGYVLYGNDGKIKRARQAFNLDIQNKTILRYLELFSKDILLPYISKQKKKAEKTA